MDRDAGSPQTRLNGNERTPLVSTHNAASRPPPGWLSNLFGGRRNAPPPGSVPSPPGMAHFPNGPDGPHPPMNRTVSFVTGPSNAESALPSHVDGHHASHPNRTEEGERHSWKFSVIIALSQILLIGLFLKFVRYSEVIDASRTSPSTQSKNRSNDDLYPLYPLFQSNTLLIFFGISFLYFFMKKYGFTSAGYNFFICALGIELSILLQGFLQPLLFKAEFSGYIEIDIGTCLRAEFSAVTVPIALGCVLGKIGPIQLLVFSLIELIFYNVNEMIGRHYLHVSDAGGSVSLHAFACYYGLAACAVLYKPNQETSKNLTVSHTTDLFAIGGTLMLWCIWPSFNSALLMGSQHHRALLNTFLSLVGSCLATFGMSSFLSMKGKFNMTHIQNATLAGGVAIGTCCNLMVHPGGALLIGTIAGCACTSGMHFGSPFLARVLKIHDVSSVHNLHGLPAIIACVSSAFMAIWATRDVYQDSLYVIYPAMAPDSMDQISESALGLGVRPGHGWTRSFQAVMQLIGLLMTVCVAMISGTLAGHIMKLRWLDEPPAGLLYTDEAFWEPKAGKVFVFDGSVTTIAHSAHSPNSVRRGTFVIPSTTEHLSYMWNQQNRFHGHHAETATPNLSDIEETADHVDPRLGESRPSPFQPTSAKITM